MASCYVGDDKANIVSSSINVDNIETEGIGTVI